jgi:hypothetical protein
MNVLFDQGTPAPLRPMLSEHSVETAFELGWHELKNGELLSASERENFEVLITTDQNLRYQQNLQGRKIAIAVLLSTSWPRIRKNVETIRNVIDQASPRFLPRNSDPINLGHCRRAEGGPFLLGGAVDAGDSQAGLAHQDGHLAAVMGLVGDQVEKRQAAGPSFAVHLVRL